MSIVALKYAQANAVHNIIRTLLDQAPLEGLRSTVDERTNRLVLSGTPDQLKEVLQLIEVLDVPGPEATDETGDAPTTGTPQPVQR